MDEFLQIMKTLVAKLELKKALEALPNLEPRLRPLITVAIVPGQHHTVAVFLDATQKADGTGQWDYEPLGYGHKVRHMTCNFAADYQEWQMCAPEKFVELIRQRADGAIKQMRECSLWAIDNVTVGD